MSAATLDLPVHNEIGSTYNGSTVRSLSIGRECEGEDHKT
jgi:hypothetical protein